MKKTILITGLLVLFFTVSLFSQVTVKVLVEKITVLNNADCDAGASDNSDFLFEFKATDNSPAANSNNAPVAGSIGMCNYAAVNENNGPFAIYTATPGLAVFSPTNGVFFNRSYNCIHDVPTAITIVWRGYENDDVSAPSVIPVAGGATAVSSMTVPLTAHTTSTIQSVQYTLPSLDGSCPQTYQIDFKIITSTGAFYPLYITNLEPTTICLGANNGTIEADILGGSGTVLFDWSNDGTNDFDDPGLITGLSTGSYTVVVKDALNCTDTMISSITAVSPPANLGSFITSTTTVCAGQTGVPYSVATQTDVVYYWNNTGVGVAVIGTGSSITLDFANSAQTGILSVYAQNSCSTSPTLTLPITVTPLPTLTISGNNSMCDNVQEVLTGSGAATYTWSTGATTASIAVTPTSTTVYTVSGTTNNCSSVSQQFTMTVLPSPTVQVTGSTATVCPNSTVALSSNGSGSVFVWSDGFIGANHTVFSAATTVYTVSNVLNTCIKQATYTLNVYPLPNITVSGNTIVCPGKTLTVTASGANTYNWSTGSSNASITYTPSGISTLTVTGTNTVTGCINSQTVNVNTFPAGLVSITGNTAICNTLQGVLTASGSDFYLWNNGATASTNTISPSSSTTVSVVGTTLNGCKDSTSVPVTVINNVSIIITGADTICQGQTTVINANVVGATTYSWNTGATTQSISVSPASTFIYIITASNPGCSGSKLHQLYVKLMPVINFSVNTPMCINAGTNTLTATPLGGTYLGAGVSGNTFDPSVGAGTYSVTYQVTGTNGCSASSTQTVEVDLCAGINEQQQVNNGMSIYPNPSQGNFFIQSSEHLKSVLVVDYTGKQVKLIEFASPGEAHINLSGFSAGIYSFVISTVTGNTETIKVIKE